jgi:hypothetical protein
LTVVCGLCVFISLQTADHFKQSDQRKERDSAEEVRMQRLQTMLEASSKATIHQMTEQFDESLQKLSYNMTLGELFSRPELGEEAIDARMLAFESRMKK